MRQKRQEGIKLLYSIKKLSILFYAVLLIIQSVYCVPNSDKKTFSFYYEGRTEYGSLDTNEDRDKIAKSMVNSLKLTKDLITRSKFQVSLSNDFDFYNLSLTDYGLDNYKFHFIPYNLF